LEIKIIFIKVCAFELMEETTLVAPELKPGYAV
jgi:hypothetical protein